VHANLFRGIWRSKAGLHNLERSKSQVINTD